MECSDGNSPFGHACSLMDEVFGWPALFDDALSTIDEYIDHRAVII